MPNEALSSSDGAGVVVPQHYHASVIAGLANGLISPAEHFGHSIEELLDLAHTKVHGHGNVVAPDTLVAALQPARNAVRVRVFGKNGKIKQLILDKNCRTNNGGTWLSILQGGDANANIAYINTSGANTYTATGVTPTTSPAWTVNQWAGHQVVGLTTIGATPSFVIGTILSNTATALVIDQWTNPTSTSGAAGTTPVSNASFYIKNSQAPSLWIAFSSDTTTEDIGNTTLTSEFTSGYTVVGRYKGAYSLTTAFTGSGTTNATGTYKLDSGVLTANATSTVAKLGLFHSQNGGNLDFVKKLATAATTISGDTLDASWSISLS